MHLIELVRSCVDHIIESSGSGIKSMVLDEFTTGILSVGYTRGEMLLREVYMFERIETLFETNERLNHMKCVVILRPTKENIQLLCRELNRPHYRTYYLYFTCRVGTTTVKLLSEADETEVVRSIKDLPLDFQAVTPFLFSLQIPCKTYDLRNEDWLPEGLKRAGDGLSSALIALQVNPLIRYQTQSHLCKDLAEKVSLTLKNESLANQAWRRAAPFDINSLLLVIDRRYDLVTPIINSWFYYSMIHEQFEIVNNRISLIDLPDRKPKDPREMLISMESDVFFDSNYARNYGELGITIKNAVGDLRDTTKSKQNIETMEDMRRFIDEYPETRRHAKSLHNHVFLMSALSRIVQDYDLFALSECEQELACDLTSRSEVVKKIKQLVASNKTRPIDALRLVSLYTVCTSEGYSTNDLTKLLKARDDISKDDIEFISQLRQFILTKPQNPLVQQVNRMMIKVKGVDNVLTERRPDISGVIDDLRNDNKLKERDFAFYGERCRSEPPKRLVIFVLGGVTYDEALVVDSINRSHGRRMQVVIGGTSIHNFRSFKDEVKHAIVLKNRD